jgi:acetyl-CoA acyltransferase
MPDSDTRVVLVDGCRTPFRRAGTDYADLISYDLARSVLKGILVRNALDAALVDAIIMGSVIQNPSTSNVARDAALAADFPNTVVAHTLTMACISANRAIADGVGLIRTGQGQVVISGGVETLSDVPIGFKKEVRKKFFEARKYSSPLQYARFLKGLRSSDLLPRAPEIAEYSTGEVMGESADKLAAGFGVSREAQDAFALRSHQLAAQATQEGRLAPETYPMAVPPSFRALRNDNTVRTDTSMEKLSKLAPAFVKPFGTVTAGNSSPLTDGAAATLLMSEAKALELGYQPVAILREQVFVAQDPNEELLLGPAYAVPTVLDRMGLSFSDLEVIEIHEAFAGQVLAVLTALESDAFAREKLARVGKVAEIDIDKVNVWGGSISLGHPFGATGARLVTTAANRLWAEDGHFALVTSCAAGGLGHAMIVERYGE